MSDSVEARRGCSEICGRDFPKEIVGLYVKSGPELIFEMPS